MPKLKPPKLEVAPAEEEENLEPIPSHPTWSGSISIGLVNIPVRAIPITLERKISFRMLHRKCRTPGLPEPREEKLDLAMKIVDKLTVDMDLGILHDAYREKIETIISSKLKGEAVQVQEKKPKKPAESYFREVKKLAYR